MLRPVRVPRLDGDYFEKRALPGPTEIIPTEPPVGALDVGCRAHGPSTRALPVSFAWPGPGAPLAPRRPALVEGAGAGRRGDRRAYRAHGARVSIQTARRALALALLLLAAPATSADVLTGQVVHIDDGDSLTVIADGYRRIGVRLAAIDAPEKGQPYAERARQSLARMVFD